MIKLFILLGITLLLPAATLAAGASNKQLDKNAAAKYAQHGGKQDKAAAAPVDPVRFEFLRQNLISAFYHELAHALIDIQHLPILGQEEDAADVFSVLMVGHLFPENEAVAINKGAAIGFGIDAINMRAAGREWNWASEHGANMQRYYNIACLIYGSAPERRADFAREMKLPEHRTEKCEDEFAQAEAGWGPIIDRLFRAKTSQSMQFRQSARTPLQMRGAKIVAAEVSRFNKEYSLADGVRVVVKYCARHGNTNAFYSPSRKKITFCTNLIDKLYSDASKL